MSEQNSADPVAAIKQMQREDPNAKEQWWAYCESLGNGVRDPAKHPPAFLQTFISQYQSGVQFETPQTSGDFVQVFKELQKRSENFRASWASYCQSQGKGVNDPSKHNKEYMVSFIDQLCRMSNMHMGIPIGGWGAPPAKRPRLGVMEGPMLPRGPPMMPMMPIMGGKGKGGCGGGCGGFAAGIRSKPGPYGPPMAVTDPVKQGLVDKIKTYQRASQAQKELWWSYCDTVLQGTRDPAKHDKATLSKFIADNGIA